MQKPIFRILLASCFLYLGTAAVAQETEDHASFRTWKSKSGQHTISADLLDYDKLTKTVFLNLEDGTSIEVPLDQLSTRDRQFVTREMRKRAKANRANQDSSDANPFAGTKSADSNLVQEKTSEDQLAKAAAQRNRTKNASARKKQTAPSKKLYGINWQTDIDDAMLLAIGQPSDRDDRPIMWFRVLGDLEGFMWSAGHRMRTVSFSNRKVQNLLNKHFVNMFTNTEGDPTAGMSIKHSPKDQPGACVRGNGKQNVQTIFMTPTGDIFHVATGFLPPEDLANEIEFAGKLFSAMQKERGPKDDLVATTHRRRLLDLGFNDNQIDSQNGFEQMMMMQNSMNGRGSLAGSPRGRNSRSGNRGAMNGMFDSLIKGQFLADNKFSIQYPLVDYETFEDDPTPLVGDGTSFFASQSSGSNSNGPQFVMPPINMPNFDGGFKSKR